jgi:long-chain acyl-CoA synthetase
MEAPWFRAYEEGVPRTLSYPEWTLPDLLERTTQEHPDKTALQFFVDPGLPSSSLTYRELRERTVRFAGALAALGVKKGDRVAIMLPNCSQFVIAFYAVLRLGAIAVSTNPLYVSREMKEQFEDAGCETVILLDTFVPRLREIRPPTSVKRVIVVDIAETLAWPFRQIVHLVQRKHGEYVKVPPQRDVHFFRRLLADPAPEPPKVAIAPSDVAIFQYTGGTTGIPKAAMLTHKNLIANTLQVAAWFRQAQHGKETLLAAIPFFHVYGMTTCMLYGIQSAAKVVMLPRPRPVDNVMKLLQKVKATIFPGVPTLYTAINNHKDVKKYDLTSVKCCISGAAPLPIEVAETFERLTGGKLVEGFGMTEASPVTHCNPLFGRRKVGSIGVPLPDTEAAIFDLETSVPLPQGSDGELVIRGPQVMKGYWNRPEETALTIRSGWLHTGDIARMDEDGYFYIVDRKKDMIVASGLKVLPREVEEVLFTHPKVQEAVVAGVPDPYRGETVKAYVVLKAGETGSAEEILEYCKLRLAPFKVPKQLEFRSELPKTMIGKVLRRVLVEEEKAKLKAGRTA